jgi:hypothetical protein
MYVSYVPKKKLNLKKDTALPGKACTLCKVKSVIYKNLQKLYSTAKTLV